jgi:1-acyl-sn-glycerol-3-phosphate acyltransferase
MNSPALPRISKSTLTWFSAYGRYFLRKHFHQIYLLTPPQLYKLGGLPLVVCLNHPSWWDPMVALLLSQRFFPQRAHFAPIEKESLSKYGFFNRLGFFGIDRGSRSGAATFLRVGSAILNARPECALWATAQGRFCDVRERPLKLEAGLGHLVRRSPRVAVLPLALEYAFWTERLPEAFASFGDPIVIEDGASRKATEWTALFSEALEATQDSLSQNVQQRKESSFRPLLAGKRGVGGIYDVWRSSKSLVQGKEFRPDHGGR